MINNYARDNGLQVFPDECDLLLICYPEPTTFAEATSTYALGEKVPTITLQDGAVDGRRAVSSAFTDGEITATGGAVSGMFWAAVDTLNSRLLSTGQLTNDQVVTDGNAFGLPALDLAVFRA